MDILGRQYFDNNKKTTTEEKVKEILKEHISKGHPTPIVIYVGGDMLKEEFLFNDIPVRPNANIAYGHFWLSENITTKSISTRSHDAIDQTWKDTENVKTD